jgi:hypothetical protein
MTVAEEAPTRGELSAAFESLGYTIIPGYTVIHLVLALAAIGLAYGAYRDSRLAILLALLIYPISYVGMAKSKYLLQLGFMIVIALAVVFGEAERFSRAYFRKAETRKAAAQYLRYIAIAFTLIVVLEPSLSGGQLFKGAAVELVQVNTDPSMWTATGQPDCYAMYYYGYSTAQYLYCAQIPDYWIQPMNWINANVEDDTRVVSWWDYGHWINYFGEKDCLTRNEHANTTKDLMVADKFVFGARDSTESGPADLAQFMREYKAKYVLFDYDLIAKWGALDFLACVYNNQTNMSFAQSQGGPGGSQCEAEHSPERVFIPMEPTISDYCISPDPTIQLIRGRGSFGDTYCIYQDTSQGYAIPGGMVYENNMSKVNKAVLAYPQLIADSSGREYAMYTALYFKDPALWSDDESGWDDRKGKFYDSSFYQGFFLGEMDGFTKAYEYMDGSQPYIRIFEVNRYP